MGLDDIVDKVKDAGLDTVSKAKSAVSDSAIDSIANKAKGLTPDSVDSVVDKVASAAKHLNG